MPEVAGNAAILVNPTDVAQLADALHQLATDEQLRQTLIARGCEQRKLFSWDITADLLWQSMMKTLQR